MNTLHRPLGFILSVGCKIVQSVCVLQWTEEGQIGEAGIRSFVDLKQYWSKKADDSLAQAIYANLTEISQPHKSMVFEDFLWAAML